MAGTQNQPLEYEQVCYNQYGAPGAQFGNTSSTYIAVWGATPTTRPVNTSVTNISTTAFISTSGVYGFATSTEGLQVTVALSTIITNLKAIGIVA